MTLVTLYRWSSFLGLICGSIYVLLAAFHTPRPGRIPFARNAQLPAQWNRGLMLVSGVGFIALSVWLLNFSQGRSH